VSAEVCVLFETDAFERTVATVPPTFTTNPMNEPPLPQITPEIISRRKELIRRKREESGLSAPAFARKVGIDASTVRPIIRENVKRYAPERQAQFLAALQITRDDWYRG
jgi:ribosome-binding protein aMBF1 (putative translation factor)